MSKIVSKEEQYPMGSGTLTIKVSLGDGQLGTTSVMLGNTSLGIGDTIALTVGQTTELTHQTIYIESTCRDVNSSSDYTSVTVTFTDATNTKTYTYSEQAESSGGAVIYDLTFHLS
ncbi:MAG: hypothetical protein ACFB10_08980 [Salibacteraceae bacterium]